MRAGFMLILMYCSMLTSQAIATQPQPITRGGIAFGSCLKNDAPQPVWKHVLKHKPASFIFMGDTVYADRGRYERMKGARGLYAAWQDLAANHEFSRFHYRARKESIRLLATWDDHDYGLDDAGADFPYRLAAKDAFLTFFDLHRTHTGDARQPGIYDSHSQTLLTPQHRPVRVQTILLDTRSFRSPLQHAGKTQRRLECKANHPTANEDPLASILGEEQWRWLEKTLRQPADVRLLVSSTQVLPEQHCYEKWANFPHERIRLLKLIRDSRAKGVVILSGDRHLAEISKLPAGPGALDYPLYEITSSGLNNAIGVRHRGISETNRLRTTSNSFGSNNFGLMTLADTNNRSNSNSNSNSNSTELVFSLLTERGHTLQRLGIPLSRLSPGGR